MTKSRSDYISNKDAGERINTFITQHCEKRLWKTCTKSLWTAVRTKVPAQKSGSGYGSRYNYNEELFGTVMYEWFEDEYPKIIARASKKKI